MLFRGAADDLPLLEWLKQRIWPFEAAHDERSLAASAELGLLEMMLAGTTTILDMGTVHHYDAVFDACARAGIRVFGGKAMMDAGADVPKGLRESTKSSLREADTLRETWTGKGARPTRLRVCAALHPLVHRGALSRNGGALARRRGALLHSHVAEHPDEREAVRNALGDDDLAILRRWGFKGPRTLLAHGVQIRDDEADALARDGTRIVHCPSANLKLGSGIARVHELDAARRPARARRRRRAVQQQPRSVDRAAPRRAAREGAHLDDGAPGASRVPSRDHRRRARARARRASRARSRSESTPTSW